MGFLNVAEEIEGRGPLDGVQVKPVERGKEERVARFRHDLSLGERMPFSYGPPRFVMVVGVR
jgi:hypothetical protein